MTAKTSTKKAWIEENFMMNINFNGWQATVLARQERGCESGERQGALSLCVRSLHSLCHSHKYGYSYRHAPFGQV
jgi:hypothetical protein